MNNSIIDFFQGKNEESVWVFEDVVAFIEENFKTKTGLSFRVGDKQNSSSENQRSLIVVAYALKMDYTFARLKALFSQHDHLAISMPELKKSRNIFQINKIYNSLLSNGEESSVRLNEFPEFFDIPERVLEHK